MDPNETLEQIRQLRDGIAFEVSDFGEPEPGTVEALVEKIEALDQWLSNKGHLPVAWQHTAVR